MPAGGSFEMTPWQALAHVLVHSLARHGARTRDPSSATCCVIASPAERTLGSACSGQGGGVAARLIALGERVCPGKPIVVIDGPDADGTKDALCNSLWSPASCARGR